MKPHRKVCDPCSGKQHETAGIHTIGCQCACHMVAPKFERHRYLSSKQYSRQRIQAIRDLKKQYPKLKKRADNTIWLMFGVYMRDNGICWLCLHPVRFHSASLDHVMPESYGGPRTYDNLRLTHRECNHRRDNLLPWEITPAKRQEFIKAFSGLDVFVHDR